MKKIVCLLLPLLTVGCVSLSPEDCATMDWHNRGYVEGQRGLGPEWLQRYEKNCSEHGLAADSSSYHKGWMSGMGEYCSRLSAFEGGDDLVKYYNIDDCPEPYRDEAVAYFTEGRTLGTLRQEITRLGTKLDELDARGNDIFKDYLVGGNPIKDKIQGRKKLQELQEEYVALAKKYQEEIGYTPLVYLDQPHVPIVR